MTVLIIIGYVLLFLLLLLLILLIVPVRLYAEYRDGRSVLEVWVLFLCFDLSPGAAAPKAKRKERKPKEAKEKIPEEEPKAEKFSFEDIRDLIRSSGRALDRLRRHILLSRIELYASVAKEDAHQTALAYSQTKLAVAALLDVLGLLFVIKGKPKIYIAPDFTAPEPKFRFEGAIRVAVRPLFALTAGAGVLLNLLRMQNQRKAQRKVKQRELVKGGKTT